MNAQRLLAVLTLLAAGGLGSAVPALAQFPVRWTSLLNGSASGTDVSSVVRVAPDGSVYVAGTVSRLDSTEHLTVVRLDSNSGGQQWSFPYYGPGFTDFPVDMVFDASGAAYVGGTTYGADSVAHLLLIKLLPEGVPDWIHVEPSVGSEFLRGMGMDAAGHVITTSLSDSLPETWSECTASANVFVTRSYTTDGNLLWTAYSPGGMDGPLGVRVDAAGDIYVVGSVLQPPPVRVWTGHVNSPTGLPGTPGGDGPYHVGRGPSIPGADANGLWSWDNFNTGEGDSLQGWWPVRLAYSVPPAAPMSDWLRPWSGLDFGNQGNYTINQGAPKRTFGVTGYWHRETPAQPAVPIPGTTPADLTWSPLQGTSSAWCGLRSHGDLAAIDPITGNPFSQSILDFNGEKGPTTFLAQYNDSSKGFPGYGSQWDQMLYRDVLVNDGENFTVSFTFRTSLSQGADLNATTRVGWFDRDPLKYVTQNDGNFISSTDAGSQAPIDSFMVYVGAPVDDGSCTYSDGSVAPVHDPLRRWFSEVVATQKPYREIFTTSGTHSTEVEFIDIPQEVVQSILDSQPGLGGTVRLVFRVKTNRGYDDEDGAPNGFSSGTSGAAIVDNVIVNGWPSSYGNFEDANAIDNSLSVSPTNAWKSTGKPPGVYSHMHNLYSLPFDCPYWSTLQGQVLSVGDHDNNEKAAGNFGSPDQERIDGIVSPTINLTSAGPWDFNGMGINTQIAEALDDIYVRYDMYTALFDQFTTGVGWVVGAQCYPAVEGASGVKCWSTLRITPGQYRDQRVACTTHYAPLFDNRLIRTSNPSGIPDSLRVFIGKVTQCSQLGIWSGACSPTSGYKAGGYFDNVAVGFSDSSRLRDFVALKYSGADGSLLGSVTYGSPGLDDEVAQAFAVTPTGTVLISGTTTSRAGPPQGIVSVSLDIPGGVNWEDFYYAPDECQVSKAAIDDWQSLYVAGSLCSVSSGCSSVLIKYNLDGTREWAQSYGSDGTFIPRALFVPNSGQIFLAESGTGATYDVVLRGIGGTGVQAGVQSFDWGGDWDDLEDAVRAPDGDLIITGPSWQGAHNFDFFTARLGPIVVGVDDDGKPAKIQPGFDRPWPNPALDHAMLSFRLAAESRIRLALYDVHGRLVREDIPGAQRTAGSHTLRIDTVRLPAGLYLCRLDVWPTGVERAPIRQTRKLLVLR